MNKILESNKAWIAHELLHPLFGPSTCGDANCNFPNHVPINTKAFLIATANNE
ncbi:hypothetical protein JOE65_000704 [Arthrobacter roseus]|nr:hypothetical protein [Arthrobacter roseus]